MRCERCGGVMAQQRYEPWDHSEDLRIRAWRCRGCGDLMEEIRTSASHGEGEARRIRYAVAPANVVVP